MEVTGFAAPPSPNQAELLSQGYANPAFKYAFQQKQGLLPQTWEGDPAQIDAIFAIAQLMAAPPTAPTLTTIAPATAAAKSPQFVMTLTGTNFQSGMTVLFGAIAPETRVSVDSTTSARVVVWPSWIPSAGTINVSVKNGGGAAASATKPFTVT